MLTVFHSENNTCSHALQTMVNIFEGALAAKAPLPSAYTPDYNPDYSPDYSRSKHRPSLNFSPS